MSVPAGRLQFFALEATDYLDRLGAIVDRPTPPEGDEVVRLTRALRGAALMAGLAPFAHAAQAVEHLAKACRDRQLEWTRERADLIGQAVIELRRLVSRATDWSEADDQAADALADQIGKPAPDRVIEARAAAGDEDLKPSVRGFVGREGAQIAGTLEHAAQAVELGQPAETAAVVLQRLQPLRGLAALPRLSPLPEFLDAIELAIQSLTNTAPSPAAPAALRQVARAIGALSRQVAEAGVASKEDPVVMAGAQALIDTFGDESDVVPVSSLFPRGETNPIVSRGAVPEHPPQADPQIELTGLADRFRQGADQLRQASGATSRILTLFALSSHLGPLERNARRDRPTLGTLLDAVRHAIKSQAALTAPEVFSQHLQQAAEELSAVAGARNGILFADRLDGDPAHPAVDFDLEAGRLEDDVRVLLGVEEVREQGENGEEHTGRLVTTPMTVRSPDRPSTGWLRSTRG